MLAWLLSQGEVEAALALGHNKRPLDQLLLEAFDRGDRPRFWQLYALLARNEKLEFYLQVYFMIYAIHPSLGKEVILPKEDVQRFKKYLESRGPETAQHSDLTPFYALPYVKNPLKHDGYRTLFRKEWVANLRQKVVLYCRQESNRWKHQASSFQRGGSTDDKELMAKLNNHLQRYRALEQQYKEAMEAANQNLMETQNKWFAVARDLVGCSKVLLQLAGQNPRLTTERKFQNLRRKIDRYEKFVNRRIEDMITQSQDISVFDRPSINELSYTMTQYTHKSRMADAAAVFDTVQDFIPTDFLRLKKQLAQVAADSQRSCLLLKGLIWRVLKSKDVRVRRLNIIGILMHDTFGLRTGHFKELFAHAETRTTTLRLMYYIEHDYYGRCSLFSTGLIRDLMQLLRRHCKDAMTLEYAVPMLQILSVREDMMLEMIQHDLIKFFLQLLSQSLEILNQHVLQNLMATLLNLCSRPEGIHRFQQEPEAFKILAGLLESEDSMIRGIVNGMIYTLLGSRVMHQQALDVGLQQIISYMIEHDHQANIKELRYLQERLLKFEPVKVAVRPPSDSGDHDEIEEDSMMECEEETDSIMEECMKAHEYLTAQYSLPQREAHKQAQEVKEVFESTIERIHEKRHHQPAGAKEVNPHQTPSPARQTKQNKENNHENISNEKKRSFTKNSLKMSSQPDAQVLRREADTAYFVAPQETSTNLEPSKPIPPQTRPREEVLKKLNEQIRASKFRRAGQLAQESKDNASLLKERPSKNVSASHVPLRQQVPDALNQPNVQKVEEQDAFAPKPRIPRSPSNTPERRRIH